MAKANRSFFNFDVKLGFKLKFALICVMISIITANLVGAFVYFIFISKVMKEITPVGMSATYDIDALMVQMLVWILMAQIFAVVLSAFIVMIVANHIAGPLFRIERVMGCIENGDLTNYVKLRPRDELNELAAALNDMTAGLREKVVGIGSSVDKLEETLVSSVSGDSKTKLLKEVEAVRASLSEFILDSSAKEEVTSKEDTEDAEDSESSDDKPSEDEKTE